MDEARAAIERHCIAINDRNLINYLKTVAFPFTYQNYNGLAVTINMPSEYGDTFPTPWETIISTDPDWSHTDFDEIEELARGAVSVVYKLVFRRISRTGESERPSQAIWIVVLKDGAWGIQFRHNLGRKSV